MSVLIVTSLGDIVIDLHTDLCPLTSKSFLKLCKIKYYNGCLFHLVTKDFTAQTGDPTGTGTGGDSIYRFLYGDQARFFSDEIRLDLKHTKAGTVAMASAGENLNASQFYFTLRDGLDYLDGKHTVFGEVAEGLETLMRINEAYVDEKGRPFKNIRIKHTYILDDPFDDPPQLTELIPDASPEGKPKDEVDDDVRLEDDWVPMEDTLGVAELEEVIREKEAHSRAVVLESIGDIPDAEIKPPENVLFVCKLNPVTEDEDLHTIFSRFGTVIKAETIRDYKTGDSLCYAFIEFETQEACEQAYFKMDKALIDDRRIHVDFSQSVSKLWSQYRRKDNNNGKGTGCFKCGEPDHVAKDCTGGTTNQQPVTYTLKDNNTQRGGGNKSEMYDMVFDEDTHESPQKSKRRQACEPEDRVGRQKMSKQSTDREHLSADRHRHSGRDREDDERYRESKADRSSGSRRDREYREERMSKEKHTERPSTKDYNRDDRDYKTRSDERDSRECRKDENDSRKRRESSRDDNGGRRDKRDERSYGKGYVDDDGHKATREDRDHVRRRSHIDDGHDRHVRDHDRDRDHDRNNRVERGDKRR